MTTNQDDTLLLFRIDRITCAVPAASVMTIVMPPAQLTHPPGSDAGRPGIFRHSEHVFAVVDLHQRFGIETPRKRAGRLLLHENGIRRHALWVDEVVGLVRSTEGEWAALPPYLPQTLFHNGFLYEDEIVLCSTLEALLAMRDAAPIRQYLEKLRQAEETVKTVAAKPAELTKGKEPVESTPQQPPRQEAEKPTPANSPVTPQAATRKPLNTTASPHQVSAVSRTTAQDNSQTKTSNRNTGVTTQRETPTPARQPVQAAAAKSRIEQTKKGHTAHRVTPSATPQPQTPLPTRSSPPPTAVRDQKTNYWPISLVLLLLLGAVSTGLYLLLDKPEKSIKKPLHTEPVISETPPRPTPEPITPPPAPGVNVMAPTTANTESALAINVDEEHAQEEVQSGGRGGDAAIQIERDDAGTIKLIIQRDHLPRADRPSRQEPPAREERAKEENITDETLPTGITENIGTRSDEEEPLLPDPDWPRPSALPEPCDCTHIVVKGDTLWDIAQKYTNNAFNYPELARQSGIRNPHRIYPGNTVRIIVR